LSLRKQNPEEKFNVGKDLRMIRFVVRNYGVTRQVPYKGQQVIIANDKAIETDDMELVAVLQNIEAMHVTDRCPGTPGPSLPPIVKTETPEEPQASSGESQTSEEPDEVTEEIAYNDMLLKELQVLAKDRQIKVSGLNKARLIKALEKYDKEEVPEEEQSTEVVEKEEVVA